MVSYTDEIDYGHIPSEWSTAGRQLVDALKVVEREFGDEVHISGSPDYLVRFLVNAPDAEVHEKVANYFLVIVNQDGVNTMVKVGNEPLSHGGGVAFQEPWVTVLCARFRAFRQRLG